jgi:nitrogen regulatory protein PII
VLTIVKFGLATLISWRAFGEALASLRRSHAHDVEGESMKLLTAVVKPFKLDEVKEALKDVGVTGLTVSPVKGFGHTGGHVEIFRGKEYVFDFKDKLQIEILTADESVDEVIEAIVNAARTDTVGDGVVWVTDVEHVVRIRTNERGPEALGLTGLAADSFG